MCIVTVRRSSFQSRALLHNVHAYPHIYVAVSLDGWQRGANSIYHHFTMLATSTLIILALHNSNTELGKIGWQFCILEFNDMRKFQIFEQYIG